VTSRCVVAVQRNYAVVLGPRALWSDRPAATDRRRLRPVNRDRDSDDPLPALGEVRSADGTIIGYQRVGTGPGVVLVHGAGQSSGNLMRLAGALAAAFTLYVPDRRGRGSSGPYGEFHGLVTEIEDLSAVLEDCGACRVFGLSSGAVIAIEAARGRPDITKLALYEPPLTCGGVVHGDWAPRYERLLQAGKPGAALVTVLKATADRTSVLRWIPQPPLVAALDFALKRTADRPVPDGVMSPRELIPTVRYDAQTVNGAAGPLERFAGLSREILLVPASGRSQDPAANWMASGDLRFPARETGRLTWRPWTGRERAGAMAWEPSPGRDHGPVAVAWRTRGCVIGSCPPTRPRR